MDSEYAREVSAQQTTLLTFSPLFSSFFFNTSSS